MAHVLSARQGVDIDEPWDLATCRLLLGGDDPFPPCAPADVAAHQPAETSTHLAPGMPGMPDVANLANLACVVVLPPDGQERPREHHATDAAEATADPDGPYLRIAGIPAPCRVVDAVRTALPNAPLAVCGDGVMARAVARRYGLPRFTQSPLPEFLANRRAAWPVPLLTAGDLAAGRAAWPGASSDAPEFSGRDILCIDGRAALLDAATLRAFVTSALANANAGCGLPACSVSPAPVHPAHLKRVDGAGSVISAPGVPARRQDLPEAWCRDGALTLLRAGGSTSDEGPGQSASLNYHPIPIGRAQATLAASRLDAARGMALAVHDGHPDIPACPSGAPDAPCAHDRHKSDTTEPA